LHFPLNFRT